MVSNNEGKKSTDVCITTTPIEDIAWSLPWKYNSRLICWGLADGQILIQLPGGPHPSRLIVRHRGLGLKQAVQLRKKRGKNALIEIFQIAKSPNEIYLETSPCSFNSPLSKVITTYAVISARADRRGLAPADNRLSTVNFGSL